MSASDPLTADDEPLLDPEPEHSLRRSLAPPPPPPPPPPLRRETHHETRPTLQLADELDDDDEQLLDAGAANNSSARTGGASASSKQPKRASSRGANDEVPLVPQPGTPDDVLHAAPITPHPALAIGAGALGTLLCPLCGLPALALALFAVFARRKAPAERTWAERASRLALVLAVVAILSGVLLLLLYNQLAIVTLYQRVVNSAIDKRVVCDDCLQYCTDPANAGVPHSQLLSADSRSLGATVQVGCAAGYAQSGGSTAHMACARHNATHGVWTGLGAWSCTLNAAYCSAAPNASAPKSRLAVQPAGAQDALNRTLGATVLVACAFGFRDAAAAAATTTCSALNQTHGQWSALNLTCTEIADYCDEKPQGDASHAAAGGALRRSVDTVVDVSCERGYAGTLKSVCMPNTETAGRWTRAPSTASSSCTLLPDYCSAPPEEATPHALLPAGRLVRTLGVTQTLACALGYAPSPDAQQPVSATCSAHNATAGSWTVGAQFCAPLRDYCTGSPVALIAHSELVGQQTLGGIVDSVFTLRCALGFADDRPAAAAAATATCVANDATHGSWKLDAAATLQCSLIAKYCTEAANSSVPHSTLLLATGTGTGNGTGTTSSSASLGSAARVGCALGYARTASSASANATCGALNATHGLWRGLNLTCAQIQEYCNNEQRAPSNELPPNSVPETLPSGSTWKWTLGSRLNVTCELGFSGSGSSPAATCAAFDATHGTWRGFNYSCSRIDYYCNAQPERATQNALRTDELRGRARGDVAHLSCACGFQRTGFVSSSDKLTATCTAATSSAGAWLTSERCTPRANFCDAKPAATVPDAAPASEQFDRSMSALVLLACAPGFNASGAMSSTCSCQSDASSTAATGVWITSQPSACIGIETYCEAEPNASVSNSRLLDASIKRSLKNTAKVGCAPGFEAASGAPTATSTCEADSAAHGKWSAVQLQCTAIAEFCAMSALNGSVPQAELETGAAGVRIGEQVSLKCAMGFESTGSPNASCTAGSDLSAKQGVWTGLSLNCSEMEAYCAALPNSSLANSTPLGAFNRSLGATADLECQSGFSSSGQLRATCTAQSSAEGRWVASGKCSSHIAWWWWLLMSLGTVCLVGTALFFVARRVLRQRQRLSFGDGRVILPPE